MIEDHSLRPLVLMLTGGLLAMLILAIPLVILII